MSQPARAGMRPYTLRRCLSVESLLNTAEKTLQRMHVVPNVCQNSDDVNVTDNPAAGC